jgi:hypothetical protein
VWYRGAFGDELEQKAQESPEASHLADVKTEK